MNFPPVDDWFDLLGNIWIGLVVFGAAVVPSWLSRRNAKNIAEVRQQVVNQHKTNLRDDVDRVIAAVDALGRDVAGLRQDLHVERDSRASQVDDLRNDIDRMRRR